MLNQTAVKADFKLIRREPILVLFMFLPLFILVLTRLFVQYGTPLLLEYAGFNLAPYYGYVLAMSLLMAPFMLGTVCGFLMIDDRDARMFELMSVTPLGYLGYIAMRSLVPFCAAFVYTYIGYYLIGIVEVGFGLLTFIALLNAISGVIIGLVLFNYAGDKVKAIAFSKGLGLLNVLAVADLFELPWLSMLAAFSPYYWIVRLLNDAASLFNLLTAALIHVAWFGLMLRKVSRS